MAEVKKVQTPVVEDVDDIAIITEEEDDSKTEDTAGPRHGQSKKKGRRRKKKVNLDLKCPLCESGVKFVTYKDVYQLKKFTSVRGKIISTEKSGVCAKHQRQLAGAIKRSRFMALLPYVAVDA